MKRVARSLRRSSLIEIAATSGESRDPFRISISQSLSRSSWRKGDSRGATTHAIPSFISVGSSANEEREREREREREGGRETLIDCRSGISGASCTLFSLDRGLVVPLNASGSNPESRSYTFVIRCRKIGGLNCGSARRGDPFEVSS